jgi:predicted O-linked N-acetylglucosamine transferase (SPINDLY family)
MDYVLAEPVSIYLRFGICSPSESMICHASSRPSRPRAAPAALPMLRNGHVTFGVFNRIDKITDAALTLWSRLLGAVRGSKVVVKHGALDDAQLRENLIARFVAHGVRQDRVIRMGSSSRSEHLSSFETIDILLDPFPQTAGVSAGNRSTWACRSLPSSATFRHHALRAVS